MSDLFTIIDDGVAAVYSRNGDKADEIARFRCMSGGDHESIINAVSRVLEAVGTVNPQPAPTQAARRVKPRPTAAKSPGRVPSRADDVSRRQVAQALADLGAFSPGSAVALDVLLGELPWTSMERLTSRLSVMSSPSANATCKADVATADGVVRKVWLHPEYAAKRGWGSAATIMVDHTDDAAPTESTASGGELLR